MRKFKIKNRPKRKYTRKQQAHGFSISFSRSAAVGILPTFLLAIALSASVIINARPIDQTIFKNIHWPSFTFSIQDVLTTIQRSLEHAIQLSNQHHLTIKIAPRPHISWSLPNIFSTFWYGLALITQEVINGIIFASTLTAHLLLLLNPAPLFPIIGQGINSLVQTIVHVFEIAFSFFYQTLLYGIQWTITVAEVMSKTTLLTAETTVTIAIQFGILIYALTILTAQALLFLLLFLFHGFVFILDGITNAIIWVVKGIIWLIEQPFVITWKYLLVLSPLWEFIGKSLNQSIGTLSIGLRSIFSGFSHVVSSSSSS